MFLRARMHDVLMRLPASDLRGKITLALLAGTLLMGALVTLSSYFAARHQLTAHTQSLLEARSALERREIELQLKGMLDIAESLASNTVTANALADSQGRDIYLAPLLRNQKLAIPGASLTIVNYRGAPVASNIEPPPDFSAETSFARMIASGVRQAKLEYAPDTATSLLLVLPIRYRLTDNIEGGVLLRIPLPPLLSADTRDNSRWIASAAGRHLAGNPAPANAFEITAALELPPPLDTLHLVLVVARDRAVALRSLDLLLAFFLVLGILIVSGVTLFARVGARFITAPLGEIAAAAEEIAASGRPVARLPVRREDEFGRLSAAFNTMVERLGESYADLEQRVAERTREYEESQQEAVKASNLLREAVGSIAQGFTIYDENDRLVICNEAYKDFYADSRDLIVPGATFAEIVRRGAERGQYEEAIGNIDAWVARRVAQHQNASGEIIEQQLGDGRWLLIVEHRTPSGYIVGNRIDITELKRTAAALRQRELYLRATLDNLPFFFWLKDADCRFLAVNKVFANACGRDDPAELVGLTDFDVWPRELAERYQADDFEVIANGREKSVEEPVAGGSAAGWIETYKKPVVAADGTVLGTVGFARDISDRRLAEARIRDRTEQLNAIFDLSPDGFVSFDAGHHVKYASPAFFRMTGLDAASILGLDESAFAARLDAACLPGATFPGFAALRGAQKGNAAGSAAQDGGGRRQLIEMSGAGKRVLEVGIRTAQAETVSQILYFRDVTHETEVDRIKSEFLSTAAHELRTPMASIYGFAELLIHQEFDPDERRDFLNTIFRQSELMVSIINELLDLARIEARRGKDFNIERLELRALVAEIVGGFKTPDQRAQPVSPPPNGPIWVRADRKKLIQAIGNVISNAYKYSPDGGPVTLEFVRDDSAARFGVRVVDQGIGMTPEQVGRVCERFYRADTSGKIPGTGLGMSIVKEIVELLNGSLHIESRKGAGTRVTLWIPGAPNDTTGA